MRLIRLALAETPATHTVVVTDSLSPNETDFSTTYATQRVGVAPVTEPSKSRIAALPRTSAIRP